MWSSPLKWYEQAQQTIKSVEASIDNFIGIPNEGGVAGAGGTGASVAVGEAPDGLKSSLAESAFRNGPVAQTRHPRPASSTNLLSGARSPASSANGSALPTSMSLEDMLNSPLVLAKRPPTRTKSEATRKEESVSTEKLNTDLSPNALQNSNTSPNEATPLGDEKKNGDEGDEEDEKEEGEEDGLTREKMKSAEATSEEEANGSGETETIAPLPEIPMEYLDSNFNGGESAPEKPNPTTFDTEMPTPDKNMGAEGYSPLAMSDIADPVEKIETHQGPIAELVEVVGDTPANFSAESPPDIVEATRDPEEAAVFSPDFPEVLDNKQAREESVDAQGIEPFKQEVSDEGDPKEFEANASLGHGIKTEEEDEAIQGQESHPANLGREEDPEEMPVMAEGADEEQIKLEEKPEEELGGRQTPGVQDEVKTLADAYVYIETLQKMMQNRERELEESVERSSVLQATLDSLSRQLERENLTAAHAGQAAVATLRTQLSARTAERDRALAETAALRQRLSGFEGDQEKDAIIAQLTKEGERLARKQLDLETVIKQLRTKEKGRDAAFEAALTKETALERQIYELKAECDTLRHKNDELTANVRDMLSVSAELQQRSNTEQRLAEALATLSTAREEADALKLQLLETERASEARAMSAKEDAQRSAAMDREKAARESAERVSSLEELVAQLRATMVKAAERAEWQDEQHRLSLLDLQTRLRASEDRCSELLAAAAEMTRPLQRQIESLTHSASKRQDAWADAEAHLLEQVRSAEEAGLAAEDRCREAERRAQSLQVRVVALESQLGGERKALADAQAELADFGRRLEEERQQCARLQRELGAVGAREKTWAGNVERLERGREELQQRLSVAEARVRAYVDEEAARSERERREAEVPKPMLRASSSSSSNLAAEETPARLPRRGEVEALHERLDQLEAEKRRLEDRIIELTIANDDLVASAAQGELALRRQLEFEQKHALALELIGEKNERIEELTLDLQDLKEAYQRDLLKLLPSHSDNSPS